MERATHTAAKAPHAVVESSRAAAFDGVRRGIPVVLGYIPLGVAFGVLAVQNGIPGIVAVLMSLIVYAGAGQFISVGMWSTGAPVASIILTTLVVNLRHVLMSAALAPWLARFSKMRQVVVGAQLTDEAFALHCTAMKAGEEARFAQVFSLNSTAHAGWVCGTVLGVVAGDLLADPKLLGLDFALSAMFIALLVPQCKERIMLVIALFSGAVSVGLVLCGVGRWNVILSTLITATLGTAMYVWRNSHNAKGTTDE